MSKHRERITDTELETRRSNILFRMETLGKRMKSLEDKLETERVLINYHQMQVPASVHSVRNNLLFTGVY